MNTDKEAIEITEQNQTAGAGSADPNQSPVAESQAASNVEAADGNTDAQQWKAKANENWERYLRLAADFENFKKRSVRERQDAIKFANESLLEKLVAVADNFEMALAAAPTAAGANDSFKAGVAMIHQQLKSVMQEAGLTEIDATNQPFDPNWHQAVTSQESSEVPENQVIQQLRKGYKLRERLLRPATVIVAKKPAE
jgi:molecular chaperone GrpE